MTYLFMPTLFTCDQTTVLFEGRPMSQMTVIRAKIRLRKESARRDATTRYRGACNAALSQLLAAEGNAEYNRVASRYSTTRSKGLFR